MSDYRTPEEDRAAEELDARIEAAFDQAVTDGASMFAAIALGEPAKVVEHWIDQTYDNLRDSLGDEMPRAIILLLEQRMRDAARDLIRIGADL